MLYKHKICALPCIPQVVCRLSPGGEIMKTYEMLYVLDTSAADEVKDAVQKKFEDVVTSFGGNVVSVEKLGVKKLAYPISDKTDGNYVAFTFEAVGSAIKELDRVAGLTAEVLRRMITVKA